MSKRRATGSSPFRSRDVSLPMVTPSLLFSGVLVFPRLRIFGLPLVLRRPEGRGLATYLYKLTNKLARRPAT